MTKKIIIAITIILCASFITTYSFAADEIKNGAMDAANGIRNVVGNAENGVENVAKDAAGAIRKGTNDVENAGENVTGHVKNGANNVEKGAENTRNDIASSTNDGYSATRTATGMFGTSNIMWTWLILAVIAVVIVGLVWYYAAQNNRNKYDN